MHVLLRAFNKYTAAPIPFFDPFLTYILVCIHVYQLLLCF